MSCEDEPCPDDCDGRCAVIRNVASGLCLDATEYEVTVQHYNGSPAQLWILEPLGGKKYILRNSGNGNVLDIQGGAESGNQLITYEGHGGENQQWFINRDGTITSVAGNLAIDICNENFCAGEFLIAYDKHGACNQQFDIQYQ